MELIRVEKIEFFIFGTYFWVNVSWGYNEIQSLNPYQQFLKKYGKIYRFERNLKERKIVNCANDP